MKQIRNIFTLMLAAMAFGHVWAAPTVKQVIIASGGHYGAPGNKVTFYAYDPASKTSKAFDSVPGNFAREAVVDNDIIYITADSVLFRYNADTYKKMDSIILPGVNRMAINGNYLVVSRWYPAPSAYVQVYDKTSMKLLYSDNHIKDYCQSIITLRDTAYIAVTSYDSGRIAVLDLTGSTPKYAGIINMDTNATYMQDLATDGAYIYAFSYDYDRNSYKTRINEYQIATKTNKTVRGGFADLVSYLPLNGLNNDGVNVWGKVVGNPVLKLNNIVYKGFVPQSTPKETSSLDYYRGAMDTLNKTIYLVDNNFVSNNQIHVLNANGDNSFVDSFMVGSSTEAIAMDYRGVATSVADEIKSGSDDINIYPNPATNLLNVITETGVKYDISITDMTGRQIEAYKEISGKLSISVLQYPKGVYIMSILSNKGVEVKKFVKE